MTKLQFDEEYTHIVFADADGTLCKIPHSIAWDYFCFR